MSFKVVTENGALVADTQPKSADPLDQEQAEADAQRRNARAKELGLKVRYEVKPA